MITSERKKTETDFQTRDTTFIEMMEMHPYEMQLIKLLRNHSGYGELHIRMRHGLPYQIVRIIEQINLVNYAQDTIEKI